MRDVADDEHQATTVIGVGPGVKPARRIQGVLHGMDRRRPCIAVSERHQTLHAQKILTVLARQLPQRHGEIEP